MPRLTIVIATYNRAESLVLTLGSLTQQTLDPSVWEVVVVDNNSTDNTQQSFNSFIRKNPGFNIRLVEEKQQGLSPARNRGIKEAKGDIVAIIDDDELVNPGYSQAYIDFFDDYPAVNAAGGKVEAYYEETPPKWLSPIAERPIAGVLDFGKHIRAFKAGRYPGGGNMAVRREIFEKYGAFDPNLGRTGKKLLAGEEKDFFDRLAKAGEEIYYLPGAIIKHIIPASRLTKEYFVKLSGMIGTSERIRTLSISRAAYRNRILSELLKWGATLLLFIWYLLTLRPSKGVYLLILRKNITTGLISKSEA